MVSWTSLAASWKWQAPNAPSLEVDIFLCRFLHCYFTAEIKTLVRSRTSFCFLPLSLSPIPPPLLWCTQVVWGPQGKRPVPECLSPQLQPLGPQLHAETTTGFQDTLKRSHFGKHKTSPHSVLQWPWHFAETQWILLQNKCVVCWDPVICTFNSLFVLSFSYSLFSYFPIHFSIVLSSFPLFSDFPVSPHIFLVFLNPRYAFSPLCTNPLSLQSHGKC